MIIQNKEVCKLYKPLRNRLREISIEDSFKVIWAYVQYLKFDKPLPSDIEVDTHLLNAPLPEKGVYLWTLELLTREVIINSSKRVSYDETLRKYSFFAETINVIIKLEDNITRKYVNKDNISAELFRIAHRQFPWQTNADIKFLTRYFKIFNQEALDKIIRNTINLSVVELYLIGHAFLGAYFQNPAIRDNIDIGSEFLTKDKFEMFNQVFAKEIGQMKDAIVSEQQFNDKYVYAYSSLKEFPVIRMKFQGMACLVCPLPPMLFWRITSGLYYQINTKEGFGQPFGHSFQSYVGDVIANARKGDRLKAFSDEEYHVGKKTRKDTADWIVNDEKSNSAIFIECKTKRVVYPAKIDLTITGHITDEFKKMAEFIAQLYQTIGDYKNNRYKSFKYSESRIIYPIIVTLEGWYFMSKQLDDLLRMLVEKEFQRSNLKTSLLDEMPYSICSIEEFEEMIQIMQETGINNFMSDKVFDKDRNRWAFKEYIRNKFPDELSKTKFLFDADYRKLSSNINLI